MINAILIPIIRKELESLKDWIISCPAPGLLRFSLFLSIDNRWKPHEKKELSRILRGSKLKGARKIIFIDCEIPNEQSFYKKDKSINLDVERYPYGMKSGPNIQFFRSLKKVMAVGKELSSVILLEIDAYPVQGNWLSNLSNRIQWMNGRVLVAGSHPIWGETSGLIRNHINGNAIYFTGDSDFEGFLSHWERLLINAIKINCDLAYDIVLEWSYHYFKIKPFDNEIMLEWNELMQNKYQYKIVDMSKFIANLSGASDSDITYSDLELFSQQNPDLMIIHGKFNTEGKDIIREYFMCSNS